MNRLSLAPIPHLRLQAELLGGAANHLQPGTSRGADGHGLAIEALQLRSGIGCVMCPLKQAASC